MPTEYFKFLTNGWVHSAAECTVLASTRKDISRSFCHCRAVLFTKRVLRARVDRENGSLREQLVMLQGLANSVATVGGARSQGSSYQGLVKGANHESSRRKSLPYEPDTTGVSCGAQTASCGCCLGSCCTILSLLCTMKQRFGMAAQHNEAPHAHTLLPPTPMSRGAGWCRILCRISVCRKRSMIASAATTATTATTTDNNTNGNTTSSHMTAPSCVGAEAPAHLAVQQVRVQQAASQQGCFRRRACRCWCAGSAHEVVASASYLTFEPTRPQAFGCRCRGGGLLPSEQVR